MLRSLTRRDVSPRLIPTKCLAAPTLLVCFCGQIALQKASSHPALRLTSMNFRDSRTPIAPTSPHSKRTPDAGTPIESP